MVSEFKCACVGNEKWFNYVVEKCFISGYWEINEFESDWRKWIVLKWILLNWLIVWDFIKYYFVICENWMFWTKVGYLFKKFSILLKILFPKSILKEYSTVQVLTTLLKRVVLKIYWKLINKNNFAKIYFQYVFLKIFERSLLKEFLKDCFK